MDIMLERILSLIPRKPNGKFVHGEIAKFAKSIGLQSGNLISNWIAGKSKSYKDYIYEIAVKYHVSPEWLKGETDIKNPAPSIGDGLTSAQKELIRLLPLLTDSEVTVLLTTVRSLIDGHILGDSQ